MSENPTTGAATNDKSHDPLRLDLTGLGPEAAVDLLLEHAASAEVSDLFMCTNADEVLVLVRYLGLMRPLAKMSLDQGRRCLSHIKALAGMDITEKRRPLDGRWIHRRDNGKMLDLRLNSLPTIHGEDLTMRLLDRESQLLKLDHLGMLRRDQNVLHALLNSPSGLLLVTGPTGSGKTTTLYSCLEHLNNGRRKINTIEDPVEYDLPDIRQAQVNHRLDVGFAELLRSVLRQAPDVIMIGEIRDTETADTAVRAANSGHLVLATLHAPVAAGAVPALLNLGVNPHFLASALLGVIAQRLIRNLCKHCKTSFELSELSYTFEDVQDMLEHDQGKFLYGAGGCDKCHMTGYAGRTGVFEMMVCSGGIRELIMQRASLQQIRQKSIEEGLIEFRRSALLNVARGDTSIEEVFRAIPTEYLGVTL
jgi:type II secretory ATPase GspE/PulE/Tfp pilus assembly ATPase PilB-like protein